MTMLGRTPLLKPHINPFHHPWSKDPSILCKERIYSHVFSFLSRPLPWVHILCLPLCPKTICDFSKWAISLFKLFSFTWRQKSGPPWDQLKKLTAWKQRCRSRYRVRNVTLPVPTQRTTCRRPRQNCHRHHTSDQASCTFTGLCYRRVKLCSTCLPESDWNIAFLQFSEGYIFQDTMPCQMIESCQCFGKDYCNHSQDNLIPFDNNCAFSTSLSLFPIRC